MNGTIDNPTAAWNNLTHSFNYPNLASNYSVIGESYIVNGNETARVNFIQIKNLPRYIAILIDAYIDGVANGTAGRFRRNDTAADWPNNNTPVRANYFFDNIISLITSPN